MTSNSDIETTGRNKIDGIWMEEEGPMDIFNETVMLKKSVAGLKSCVTLLLGIVIVLLIGTLGSAVSIMKSASGNVEVDGVSGRMIAKHGKFDVSTLTSGNTFRFPVFNTGDSTPRPYTCVGARGAAALWRSVRDGTNTQAVLYYVPQSNFESKGEKQLGATFLWHGSTLDKNMACLPTPEQNKTLCMNFANPLCGKGSGSHNEIHMYNKGRRLFQSLVDGKEAETVGSVEIFSGSPSRHLLEEDCGDWSHWCDKDFVALELHGTAW